MIGVDHELRKSLESELRYTREKIIYLLGIKSKDSWKWYDQNYKRFPFGIENGYHFKLL